MTEMARERSNVYILLAAIYHGEPSMALLKQIKETRFLEVLSDCGVQLDNDFSQASDDELTEDLAVEYTRLFIGPGKHIPPYESVHHERDDGNWGNFWGASTVEVKKFIESTGLKYNVEYSGLPDHIGVEFDFMHEVTMREAQAWEEEDSYGALHCLKIEKKFIEEHLVKWIPTFCDKVVKNVQLSFYREMAKQTKNFIELEGEAINKYLSVANNKVRAS